MGESFDLSDHTERRLELNLRPSRGVRSRSRTLPEETSVESGDETREAPSSREFQKEGRRGTAAGWRRGPVYYSVCVFESVEAESIVSD